MGEPTAAMIELARKLIALEEASDLGSNPGTNPAIRVIEKLRLLLTRFSGLDSFVALMRRAIALSRMKDPSLAGDMLGKDGSIASFDRMSGETSLTLTAQLLELMSSFIGEGLTWSLLRDIWPVETREKKAEN